MTAAADAPARIKLSTVIGASMIGTTIEWYDFFLYGSAAALVFNKLFFPGSDPLTGTMLAFATYALGFVARPIGGLVFGHFGDRIGRKRLLMLSLLMMGGATVLIAALPTYAQIGVLAPILLIALRLVQGFAVGGEWGGAVLLVAEHGSAARRGFWTSWPQLGVASGNVLATAVLLVMAAVQSDADFLAWGWRIPFALSAVLIGIGWWVRSTVAESPYFAEQAARKVERAPALEVIRRRPRQLILGCGVRLAENIVFYVMTTFILSYAVDQRHVADKQTVLNAVLAASIAEVIAIPAFAALSDRIGRRPVYAFGAALVVIWMFVFFRLIDTGSPGLIALAIVVGLMSHAAMYGVQASFLAEMFPTRMRYSGVSLASQLTSIFAGSLAPIVATAIYKATHDTKGIVWYVAGCGLVTLIATLLARETRGVVFEVIDAEP